MNEMLPPDVRREARSLQKKSADGRSNRKNVKPNAFRSPCTCTIRGLPIQPLPTLSPTLAERAKPNAARGCNAGSMASCEAMLGAYAI